MFAQVCREVFLLSRFREEWLRTHNNRQAVVRGLEKTGSVITNAALLFMVAAVPFTFISVIDTKEVGVGMTIAVLVDATLIRSLLSRRRCACWAAGTGGCRVALCRRSLMVDFSFLRNSRVFI